LGITVKSDDLRPGEAIRPKWYTTEQVAVMLGYGLTKTKYLVHSGQIRSVKDGRNRRILPEWVDDYIRNKVEEMTA
jgi:excisionase family DNA binding protein